MSGDGDGDGYEEETEVVISKYENAMNSDMFIGSENWKRADAVSILANLAIGATYIRTVEYEGGPEIDRGYVHIMSGAFLQKVAFRVSETIEDDPFQPEEMISFPRGSLYDAMVEKLDDGGLGLKVERPLTDGGEYLLYFKIHTGKSVDPTTIATFSAKRGHFKDPVYFWNDEWYNHYLFVGKNLGVRGKNFKRDGFGLEHRMFFHEDTSYGEYVEKETTGIVSHYGFSVPTRGVIHYENPHSERIMHDRGRAVSRKQLPEIIVSFDIEPKSDHPIFKQDYDIGDMVLAVGDFGVGHFMRVIEHTLTVDKDGITETPVFGDPVMIEPGTQLGE